MQPTIYLYLVTETDQATHKAMNNQLVLADGFEDAARRFVMKKRYLRNDLEIVNEGIRSLLFVTPAGLSLDEMGVVDWDPKAAQFVGFNREWLTEVRL